MKISLDIILKHAKKSSLAVAQLTSAEKNKILLSLSQKLLQKTDEILSENAKDIALAEEQNLGEMIDRLLLTSDRIASMAQEVKNVANLHDFVGEILSDEVLESGLQLKKVRVPLGVIAMIYESRPNVTIDAAVLAFKSGNAMVLKGGKEAAYSNRVLTKIFQEVLLSHGLKNVVQLMDGATREDTAELLNAKGKIDVLIPRGGKGLIDFVTKNSRVPVIETGASVVHTFIDASADLQMAEKIILNEKIRRVSVCNALDTLLIHEDISEKFLPLITKKLEDAGVEIMISGKEDSDIYVTEWLDMKISLRIVSGIDEALEHIQKYSLGHSESIVTEDAKNAEFFLNTVDAACVYHNASTCFSDGAQFGLGAEIGISTQKLHVRGPFALEGLTSIKWKVLGNGEVRE